MTHRIVVEPIGRELECAEDQTVLDACLRAGVWLPHSCTHGTCATCKAEILDGEVDHGDSSSFALMDFERDEGKFLPCSAKPRSDLVIEAEIDVDEDLEVFPVADYKATVVALDDVAEDVRRLTVELDRELLFNAGQYLKFAIPGKDTDRTWSIASPPTENTKLEFHIQRVPDGLATDGWVFKDLSVGDVLDVSGPYGRFVLKSGDDRPAIFVAGGTGLAPITSMLIHGLRNGEYDGDMVLYQGARTRDRLYDVEFFQALEEEFEQFTYRPCLSEETVDGFGAGLVTDVIAEEQDTLRGWAGYLCGPPLMVEAALKTLMSKRLFPRDIFREDFFNEGDKASGGVKSPLIKR